LPDPVGSQRIRLLVRQEAGEDGQTPGEGKDGGVSRPVPVPFRDRLDDVGAGSNNGSDTVAGSRDEGGAVLRHAEDSGVEHLPRGGGTERKGRGKPGIWRTKA